MALRAVLWDMDGTLLDPNGSIRGALNAAVASVGHAPFGEDEVLVGMPLRDILRIRTADEDAIEAMVEEFRRISYEETWRLVRWYPGVKEAVQWCRDQGLKTAVVTTKGEQEAQDLLEQLGDAGLFDAVVGDNDRRPLKPDPAPLLEALDRLGVEAGEAAMVGDTRYDMDAGWAAGCHTIGVTWGHGASSHGPQGADVVATDAAMLTSAVQAWLQGHKP